MHRIIPVMALFTLSLLSACQPGDRQENRHTAETKTPVIVVVNYPLEFIVESLVGSDVEVLNPVPAGFDPETWFPDDEMIQTIQKADLIITNGADFSGWVKKLSLPRAKVLRTSLALKTDLITVPDFEVHSHGTGAAHSHAGTVAFFWLDPTLMSKQADAIGKKLTQILPREKENISTNLKQLKNSLEPLDQKLDQLRSKHPGLHWFTQRPVYQYLARHADWEVHHLHWKKNSVPTENTLDKIKQLQEQYKIRLMLWEADPGKKIINSLKQRGISSVVLDPLSTKPAKGNYLTEMQRQLNQLEEILKQNSLDQKPPENQ